MEDKHDGVAMPFRMIRVIANVSRNLNKKLNMEKNLLLLPGKII